MIVIYDDGHDDGDVGDVDDVDDEVVVITMMMMLMMKVNIGMLKAEALTASKPELRPALQSIARYIRRGYILYTTYI